MEYFPADFIVIAKNKGRVNLYPAFLAIETTKYGQSVWWVWLSHYSWSLPNRRDLEYVLATFVIHTRPKVTVNEITVLIYQKLFDSICLLSETIKFKPNSDRARLA